MKDETISKKSAEMIDAAYMRLLDALVVASQIQGGPNEKSQYDVRGVMNKIVFSYEDNKDNPVIRYLFLLHLMHNKIVPNKSMRSKNKTETMSFETNPIVRQAIDNLKSVIKDANQNILCHLEPIQTIGKTFGRWLYIVASRDDIVKLEKDPRYFGTLYNRYVMRQLHK